MRDFTGIWHTADDPTDAMAAQFYTKPVIDKQATNEAPDGRMVFMDQDWVRLRTSADQKSEWDMPVKEEHKFRFRRGWEAFEKGAHDEITGTPLTEWNEITRSMAMNLNQLGFMSVEDVASVQDDELTRLGQDSRLIRDRARAFVTPRDRAQVEMERTVQDQQREIENLKAQIEQMLHMERAPSPDQDEADAPKRRGRPPKVKEAA